MLRSFDFAVLLKAPGAGNGGAVAAALLDIYGSDLAELFVVSTHPKHRGKGHAKVITFVGNKM